MGFWSAIQEIVNKYTSALRNLHENFPLKSWSSWICETTIRYLTPLVGSFALMEAHMSWNTYKETVLEITVAHWPFSKQSQHLTQ